MSMNIEELQVSIAAAITSATEIDSITPAIVGNLLTKIVELRYKTEFTLVGDIDGTNAIFATELPYLQASIKVYLDGLRLTRGTHYAENGNTGILFVVAPPKDSRIIVDYIPVTTTIEPDPDVFSLQFSDEFGFDGTPIIRHTTTLPPKEM